MKILGLSCYNGHDSAACLVVDGQLVAFAEEERFNRVKHTRDYPKQAIDFCLKQGKVSFDDIDYVAHFWKPHLEVTGNLGHFFRYFPKTLSLLKSNPSHKGFVSNLIEVLSLRKTLSRQNGAGKKTRLIRIHHHRAHAASTFFLSPFEKAAILTLDSRGESTSGLLARGNGNRITPLKTLNAIDQSLGNLYATLTDYLGYEVNEGEGKVMGLAAYGTPALVEDFRKLVFFQPQGSFRFDMSYFNYHLQGQKSWYSGKLVELLGPPRHPEEKVEQRHADIAYGLQKLLEEIALHLARWLHEATGETNLCLAGGVALNCLMNRTLLDRGPFKRIFVQPAASDSGTAIGCAYHVYHTLLGRPRCFQMEHMYWGPEYTDSEIEKELQCRRIPYEKLDQPEKKAAQLLADGKIVGWFQGRMEGGPRALGNRSILGDPRRADMKDILNRRVKNRESFRPFAPSVLEEEMASFFDTPELLPFMTVIANIHPEKRSLIPAVTHVDGTARVQSVSKKTNPRYWNLIHEFQNITGIPVVLNTSFNEKEPIVCNPSQAIECFQRTHMDALIMGSCYLQHK